MDDAAIAGDGGVLRRRVDGLDLSAIAFDVVEGLEAVGGHAVNVERESEVLMRTEHAGVVLAIEEERVEGAVGDLRLDGLLRRDLRREEIDGAAVGRLADGGCEAGAAVEVYAANPEAGEEDPGVMGGIVAVVEGDAVPGDVEVAVLEAAEVDGALAEADAVGVVADGAGGDADDLGVVGVGCGEVPDVVAADDGLRLYGFKGSLGECVLGGDGVAGDVLHFDGFGDAADMQRNGYVGWLG